MGRFLGVCGAGPPPTGRRSQNGRRHSKYYNKHLFEHIKQQQHCTAHINRNILDGLLACLSLVVCVLLCVNLPTTTSGMQTYDLASRWLFVGNVAWPYWYVLYCAETVWLAAWTAQQFQIIEDRSSGTLLCQIDDFLGWVHKMTAQIFTNH